jgi:hypothetical protein
VFRGSVIARIAALKNLLAVAALLVLLSIQLLCVDDTVSGLADGVFSDAEIGFRYTLPRGLTDETSYSREELRKRAAAQGTSNNTLEILLRMTSGPPDTHLSGTRSPFTLIRIPSLPGSTTGPLKQR